MPADRETDEALLARAGDKARALSRQLASDASALAEAGGTVAACERPLREAGQAAEALARSLLESVQPTRAETPGEAT